MAEYSLHISLTELCEYTNMPVETIVEFVEYGILEPQGRSEETWVFSAETVQITHRAIRLHRDLGMNWAGVALALDLMSEREILRRENEALKNRLRRFLIED